MENSIDPGIAQAIAQRYLNQAENLVKFQLDPNNELEILKMELLAVQVNENGDLVPIPGLTPLINQQGANVIMSFLRSRLGKVVSLSNLDDQDVSIRCRSFMDSLTFLLGRHYSEFSIPSYQVMDSIIELCDDVFFTTMMKAYNAGERDTLRKQFTHVESSERIVDNRQPIQQPQGFKLPFIGGK